MKVRIGARVGEVFSECGGFTGNPWRIVCGSPLRGRVISDLNEPVIKTSYAIFAVLKSPIGHAASWNCIGCGECRAVCPVGLDPEMLYKAHLHPGGHEECHGCGCCEVVCPSHLPLSAVIQAKQQGEQHAG
jgi:electron transport complex protein RnfC